MNILERAIIYATNAHESLKRKNSTLPYAVHLMETMVIASTITQDMDVLAAAVLHDTVEDAGVKLSEIEKEFGHYVAQLVASETEDKMEYETEEATWIVRKHEAVDQLRIADDRNVRIIWLSDKLSNIRAIRRDYDRLGESIWNTFHMKDPREQAWYYRTIAELLEGDLGDTDAWKEFDSLVKDVFKSV